MNTHKIKVLLLTAVFCLSAGMSWAAVDKVKSTEIFQNFVAEDMPYDSGSYILLRWPVTLKDTAGITFDVYAALEGQKLKKIDSFGSSEKTGDKVKMPFWAWPYGSDTFTVEIPIKQIDSKADVGSPMQIRVEALENGKTIAKSETLTVASIDNWFNLPRLNGLIMLIVVIISFFLVVSRAKRKGLFIRRIAGLDAIDEAIGRATEMGKPIYYSTGINGMSGVNTIASLSILGEVSKKVADYDSIIKIPHYDPIVMSVAKETVKQSYIEAGRPDSYRDDSNFFLSSDQFSYAASLDGMIEREKPAACFFMGYFMAESLLLTEVGATTGAIQIAATDSESQLPFFFTSCDYTLIGEELYAAGAYLSKEPMLLSVLKLQDFGKLFMMLSIIIGSILVAVAAATGHSSFVSGFLNLFTNY